MAAFKMAIAGYSDNRLELRPSIVEVVIKYTSSFQWRAQAWLNVWWSITSFVYNCRKGTDGRIGNPAKIIAFLAEELTGSFQVPKIHHDYTECGDDFFTPNKPVQLIADFVVMAEVGICQAFFYAF